MGRTERRYFKLISSLKRPLYEGLIRFYPLIIALFLLQAGFRFGGFDGTYINSDGKGYYAYLPATFIFKDFSFSFTNRMDEKYYLPGARADIRKEVYGKPVNKYFAGVALLWLPFFFIAHWLSLWLGFPADGYSTIYQHAILCAAIFYLWIGLLYLRKLLRLYHLSEAIILITSFLTVFATALIFYTICNPDWSHVYSFTLITAFVYYSKKLTINFNRWKVVLCLTLLGIILLIRPLNGMVVLSLPFIAGSWEIFRDTLKKLIWNPWQCFIGLSIFVFLASIQFVFYYLETGYWFIWAYTGEGFNFFRPHFFESLVSYKRGLFVYTPLTFISLFGFVKLFKDSLYKGLSLLIFLVMVIYAISSWHCWWYGMCFQLRPVTEYLCFFAILLGVLLTAQFSNIVKTILYGVLAFILAYNSIQVHQYRRYILHWSEMDRDRFWKIFMRTDPDYEGLFWGTDVALTDIKPKGIYDTVFVARFGINETKDFARFNRGENNSILINKKNAFTPVYRESGYHIADSYIFYISALIKPVSKIRGNTLNLVLSVNNDSGSYRYQCMKFDLLKLENIQWYKIGKILTTNPFRSKNDTLNIYFWNPGNQKIQIKNILIEQLHSKKDVDIQ
jgi:hypothetical protein